jgi:cyclopropane fatty-acyl-phospholipid synthase-like methyltransferase
MQAEPKTSLQLTSIKNIDYRLCDIRTQIPEGQYDNIVWDAAIEHFTELEIDAILSDIKARLKTDGVLSGYTLCEKEGGQKHLTHHEYEFKSKEDLRRFFEPHFSNVKVFETIYPTRHNLYFYASNAVVPFDEHWGGQTNFKR